MVMALSVKKVVILWGRGGEMQGSDRLAPAFAPSYNGLRLSKELPQ
jgi:hypothetical protein